MILIASLLATFCFSPLLAQQPEYGQCGGIEYTGPTQCVSGTKCYVQHQYYSQCLTSCPPTGWECSKFPYCQFRFGLAYNTIYTDNDYSVADYITFWIGQYSWSKRRGEAIAKVVSLNKVPVFFAYFIAFMAKEKWGLQDCNVGVPNLCEKGSNFIRSFKSEIVSNYKNNSAEIAKITGRDAEVVFMIEQDFQQYYSVLEQEGGPLTGTEMRELFDDFVNAIKSELPNARISWNVSAFMSTLNFQTWWAFFSSSLSIDYVHTGNGVQANSTQMRSGSTKNRLTWSFVSTLTAKKIIANIGYGVGGGYTGHNDAFDDFTNLSNRITEGLMSVSQTTPSDNWGSTLASLRSQLPALC